MLWLIYRNLLLPMREKLKRAVLWPYYFIYTSKPVWALLNQNAAALYEKNKFSLNAVQEKAVKDLKDRGIAITHLDELFPGSAWFEDLNRYAHIKLKEARVGRKKAFLMYLWKEFSVLDFDNPFVKLSLNPKILEITGSYIGMYPKFRFFSAGLTTPIASGAETLGSQRWHRDPGIKRICKMFIYLTDVDETAGPFTYTTESHLSGKWGKLFPQELFGRLGCYPPESAVEKLIPSTYVKSCVGRAGTVIFCDTMGLHKGGYATGKERLMYTAEYAAEGYIGRPRFKYPENFESKISRMPLISQFAVHPK